MFVTNFKFTKLGLQVLYGGMPWFYFERWFYSAFPSVELDFGPQHLRIDAKRRERIKQFLIVVAIPLVIAVIYDMVKEILESR